MNIIRLTKKVLRKFLDKGFPKKRMGYCGKNVTLSRNTQISGICNVYLHDDTNIYSGALILATRAKFIMKKKSGAAQGLTVITGGHMSLIGKWFKDITDKDKDILDREKLEDQDIIVEEDVWIGANVTLLKGVIVGRGATVGSGSVCRFSVPPYSIVIGNPAKVIGFKFSPEETIEHEKILYQESERLPQSVLERNYKKYFIDKGHEIKNYLKL